VEFPEPPRQSDDHDAVPEVPLHLSTDRGDGEGQEVGTARSVEPVHGQDQPHHGNLLDVGAGFPAKGVFADDASTADTL
jgi:hypothetical protein